jgi:hypothetical protein
MPEQPADDTVWCDVCQENVTADYAHAHTPIASDEAIERLRDLLKRRDEADDEDSAP